MINLSKQATIATLKYELQTQRNIIDDAFFSVSDSTDLTKNLAYKKLVQLLEAMPDKRSDDCDVSEQVVAKIIELAADFKKSLLRSEASIRMLFSTKVETQHSWQGLLKSVVNYLEAVEPSQSNTYLFPQAARQAYRRVFLFGDAGMDPATPDQVYFKGIMPSDHEAPKTEILQWFFNPAEHLRSGERGHGGLQDAHRANIFLQFNSKDLPVSTIEKLISCYVQDPTIMQLVSCTTGQALMQTLPGIVIENAMGLQENNTLYAQHQWTQTVDLVSQAIDITETHFTFEPGETNLQYGYRMSAEGELKTENLDNIRRFRNQFGHVDDEGALTAEQLKKQQALIDEVINLSQTGSQVDQLRVHEIKKQLAVYALLARQHLQQKKTKFMEMHAVLYEVKLTLTMQSSAALPSTADSLYQPLATYDVSALELSLHHPRLSYAGPKYQRDKVSVSALAKHTHLVIYNPNRSAEVAAIKAAAESSSESLLGTTFSSLKGYVGTYFNS